MTAHKPFTPPELPTHFSQLDPREKLQAMQVTAHAAEAWAKIAGTLCSQDSEPTSKAFGQLLLLQAELTTGWTTSNDAAKQHELKTVSIDYTTAGGVPVSLNLQLTAAEVEFITDRQALQAAVASDAACRQVPCVWRRRLDALTEACESHLTDFDPAKFLQALKAATAPIA